MANDATIIFVIAVFLIAMGVLVPIVNNYYGEQADLTNVGQPVEGADEIFAEGNSLSIVDVVFSIATMFVWSFGALWWPIELFVIEPIRLLGYFILARNIWIGGGA